MVDDVFNCDSGAVMVIDLMYGLVLWWLWYTMECAVNGSMERIWSMAFVHMVQDVRCNLPIVGWKYRLELTNGDEKWAKMLPGRWHLLFTHVLLPTVFIWMSPLVEYVYGGIVGGIVLIMGL